MAISIIIPAAEVQKYETKFGVKADSVTAWEWPNKDAIQSEDVRATFATGRVVCVYEQNGYNDSDFFAVYIDDAGRSRHVCYGTTRAWSYANTAAVDATPEVMEAYERIQEEIAARDWAKEEARRNEEAAKCGITREQYDRLCAVYGGNLDIRDAIVKLLSSKLRSEFRKNLAKQVREWLDNPNPKHRTPLSTKQAICL